MGKNKEKDKHEGVPPQNAGNAIIPPELQQEIMQRLSQALNSPEGLTKENLRPIVGLLLANPQALEFALNSPLAQILLDSNLLSSPGPAKQGGLDKNQITNVLKTLVNKDGK